MFIQESPAHNELHPQGVDPGEEDSASYRYEGASLLGSICGDVITASLLAEHALWYLDETAGPPSVGLSREHLDRLTILFDKIIVDLEMARKKLTAKTELK